jgi:hypothetical protein
MPLEIIYGYLHAIAAGPMNLKPRHWKPASRGDGESMMPQVESNEKLNRILGLNMRVFNSIITFLEDGQPEICPQWCAREYRGRRVTTQKEMPTRLLKACTPVQG